MYTKCFASMYFGSMYGKGVTVFAVWTYAIINMKPLREEQKMVVELNPELVANTLGDITIEEVNSAIKFLCSPDPRSATKTEEGRRLIRESEFSYWVVNGWTYTMIKNRQSRREQQAENSRRWREKQKQEKQEKLRQNGRSVGSIPSDDPG